MGNNIKQEKQTKQVEINGIPIHVELPPYFISPDIEKAWQDYPRYLQRCIELEKEAYNPARFLNEILAKVGETGERREEIVAHYSQYVGGAKVLKEIEEAWAIYNAMKATKSYIRITDVANRVAVYSFPDSVNIIRDRLAKGEKLMVEPIEFIPDTTNETITK